MITDDRLNSCGSAGVGSSSAGGNGSDKDSKINYMDYDFPVC